MFGSAVRPDFDPDRSDLDFAVEFNNLTIDNAADRYLGLLVDLGDLFARGIDLVCYQAIQNPYFKEVVDSTSVTGPSFSIFTRMSAPKLPVWVSIPRSRNCPTKTS